MDISQGVAFRFGETIKAYMAKNGTADAYTLSSLYNNTAAELTEQLKTVELGRPETFTDQLKPVLANVNIWGVDLYAAGLGEKVEAIFRDLVAGPGAVRETLKKYLA